MNTAEQPGSTRSDYRADARAQAERLERTPTVWHLLALSAEMSVRVQREISGYAEVMALVRELESLDAALAHLQASGHEISTESLPDALLVLANVSRSLAEAAK